MSDIIKTEVKVNPDAISGKLEDLINNDQTMLEIHNLYAKMMEPYVPFGSDLGNLEVTPEYVRYNTPYAHYHYEGITYGRNVPIIENGIIVGWFSLPYEDGKKRPTGTELKFQKPKASAHWDKAMLAEKQEEFVKQVEKILTRRAKELYG